MKKLFSGILFLTLLCGLANANPTILEDNFDSENGGVGVLNYNSFTNWTVSDGTVDLIGNGYFDFLPGNGLYVDMDGSTGNAGLMQSKLVNLNPGSYKLTFELAGNHRNDASETVKVKVDLGNVFSEEISLTRYDPFILFERNFTISTATSAGLSFEGIGGDNIGMLLDDVKLELIPAPGAMLLGGLGIGLVGWLRRRRSL